MGTIAQLKFPRIIGLLVFLLSSAATFAQDAEVSAGLKPLPAETAAQLEQLAEQVRLYKADIALIEERMVAFEGVRARILALRRDKIWTSMFNSTLIYAQAGLAEQDKGFDVAAYMEDLAADIESLPAEAYAAVERVQSSAEFPTPELPPNEFIVKDQRLFQALESLDAIYRALITYTKIAKRFGIDTEQELEYLRDELGNSATNRSIFLETAISDVKTLRSAVSTLPTDTDLAAWLSAVQTRINMTAKALQNATSLMNSIGMDTRQYRQQVLTVTGEITTDILDIGIVKNILSEWSDALWQMTAKEGPRLILTLLLVALIIFAFFHLAKLVQKGVERGLNSAGNQMSYLLRRMIVSSVRNLVMILGILVAISQLGISLAPLLAGLGIAGFIVGFALQDSLSNFASGVMILIYRPFDVGDFVDAAGVRGRVNHMSLVNTTFMTLDNQTLVVPNNMIWQSVITNITAQRTRRVDLTFGISYSDDIEKAEAVLLDILDKHDAVLDNPEPVVKVHELGESAVKFVVRPWVKTADYWETYWALTKEVKLRFDKEGISIPFPQRDVHVREKKPV
jgi:small conductance mechanosensitive channel